MSTYRVNITVDEDLKYILDLMHKAYPALKDADLIKMATSGYFSLKRDDFEHVEFLNEVDSDSLMQAKSEPEDAKIPTFKTGKNLVKFLQK
jgi:hypothetical protein